MSANGHCDANKHDVFIAHASEDKDAFVRPLAERLKQLGVDVWYDEFSLRPGDSLVGAIDRGLAQSRFGVVVLSSHFLRKAWPEYERRGLTAKEIGRSKVVIPVWLGVGREEVLDFSPPLADKLAITAAGSDVRTVALQVVAEVRPDIYERLSRIAAFEQYVRGLPVESARIEDLKPGPLRHQTLPRPLLLRLRVIQQVFYDVFPISFEETVRSFQADLQPEKQTQVWEVMAATYLQISREQGLGIEGKRELFGLVLQASLRGVSSVDSEGLQPVRADRVQTVWTEVVRALAVLDRPVT
jgi:hypothetical protein